jgi:hypothetical protein
MKSEVKERTSFAATERWGWKPGHPSNASPLNTDKEPPPPDISGLMRKKIEIYEDENGDTRIRELDEVDWASARKTIDAILNTNNPSIRQIEKDANLAYFEAQIHGTVAPRDIEAIYAPKNERISDADMDLAKQLGIPIYYLP